MTEADGSRTTAQLHLEYEPYLTAAALADVVGRIARVYDVCSLADELAAAGLLRSEESELQITTVETGHSIDITFLSGLAQSVELRVGAPAAIVGGAGGLAVLVKLMVGSFRAIDVERTDAHLRAIGRRAADRELEAVRDAHAAEAAHGSVLEVVANTVAQNVVEGLMTPDDAIRVARQLEPLLRGTYERLHTSTFTTAVLDGHDLMAPAAAEPGPDKPALEPSPGAPNSPPR